MLFLTYWFVLYAVIVYPLYWAVRAPLGRLLLLLAACAVFHTHFAGPAGVLPIVVLAVATYLAGLSQNRVACVIVIVASVAALIFYKYTRFLCQQVIAAIVPSFVADWVTPHEQVLFQAPPLAISFFVFEFVHYLVDVTRGSPPMKGLLDFSLYSIFWPSIVAGPVKRYQEFLPALHAGVCGGQAGDTAVGLSRVGLGLCKKLIADNLTAFIAFHGPRFASLDLGWRWVFLSFIALRILLDFSGYSDMAIGFARMHGIRLPENFNWPYLATSITTFWHRWHISLSLWIRDYVYIALGGSRCGMARKIGNGLLAFGICGMWHGAGWNFLAWGLYHGLGLAICSSYRTLLGPAGPVLARWLEWNRAASWLLTMLFVSFGWLLFFYPLSEALTMMKLLLGAQ